MYDDVLNWFRSPIMMFLLVAVAGGLGYLHATGNMAYLHTGFNVAKLLWQNIVSQAKQAAEPNKTQQQDKKK